MLNLCTQLISRLQNSDEELEMQKRVAAWKAFVMSFSLEVSRRDIMPEDLLNGYSLCHWTQLRALLCHNPYYLHVFKIHIIDLFCPIEFIKHVEQAINLFLESFGKGLDEWKSLHDFPDSELLALIKAELKTQDHREVLSKARESALNLLKDIPLWRSGAQKPYQVSRLKAALQDWWLGLNKEDLKRQVLDSFSAHVRSHCASMLQTSLIMQMQAPRGDPRIRAILEAFEAFEEPLEQKGRDWSGDLSQTLFQLSKEKLDGDDLAWLNCTPFNRRVDFQTGESYVFSNPAYMHGLFKIGQTKGSSTKRAARGGSSTWIPSPFKEEYVFKSRAPFLLEQAMHHIFDKMRWSSDREFFTVPLKIIVLVGNYINADIEERGKTKDLSRFRLFVDETSSKKLK